MKMEGKTYPAKIIHPSKIAEDKISFQEYSLGIFQLLLQL